MDFLPRLLNNVSCCDEHSCAPRKSTPGCPAPCVDTRHHVADTEFESSEAVGLPIPWRGDHDNVGLRRSCSSLSDTSPFSVNPELFPTTVITIKDLMAMDRLEPYHVLHKRGRLVQDLPHDGIVIFVSHQWLSNSHPDPDSVQLRALQRFLGKVLDGKVMEVMSESDWQSLAKSEFKFLRTQNEVTPSSEKILRMSVFKQELTVELFTKEIQDAYIWLDFISVPQPALISPVHAYDPEQVQQEQLDAIHSIPYYVERCSFFVVVAPRAIHSETGEICDLETWRTRGWCRLEECANFLAVDMMAPIIVTERPQVTVETFEDFWIHIASTREGAVGCGHFSCCTFGHKRAPRRSGVEEVAIVCDKEHCLEVLKRMWKRKAADGVEKNLLNVQAFTLLTSATMFAPGIDSPWTAGPCFDDVPDDTDARIERLMQGLPMKKEYVFSCAPVLGCPQLAKDCIARGLNMFDKDLLGRTPLHNACVCGSDEQMEVLLAHAEESCLDLKQLVNLPNTNTGITPLMRAAQQGHITLLKRLLAIGADVAPKRFDTGKTALHEAVQFGRAECAKLLINAKADLNAKDSEDCTPLLIAASSHTPFGSQRGKMECAGMLVAAGARTNAVDKAGRAAIDIAISEGNIAFLDILEVHI